MELEGLQGPFGLSRVPTIVSAWWQEVSGQGVRMGPHWVCEDVRPGKDAVWPQRQQLVHLLDSLSFVVQSPGDVRVWVPSQPELPQELRDPVPWPSLLVLQLGGLYKAQAGVPCGPFAGRNLSPGPGYPLMLQEQVCI